MAALTIFSLIPSPQIGLEVRFADAKDIKGMASLIDNNTKAVFREPIGNPAGNIIDLAAIAEMAHKHGVPVIVDNTVPTPYLCRPFEHGCDIVVHHSLTKYPGGHGISISGALVDSGKFPWAEHKERFKVFNGPDVSYTMTRYIQRHWARRAYIGRARAVPLRNMGSAISPFNSFLILQGIETLPVRMDWHCDNALAVANHLRNHKQTDWVRYAGLSDHPDFGLVKKYCNGKAAGILSFGIKGGRDAGARFIDALRLITRLVNIGDAKSLACHPATTTHRQLSPEELVKAGVSEDLVRLFIGLEHIDGIIGDINQALDKA